VDASALDSRPMPHPAEATPAPSSIGELLQYWRRTRHLSQLALATEAEVSPRHICFLETGRSRPSREMVLLLASVLEVPLRERNGLLLAAGFAPVYAETSLDQPPLAPVRAALEAILRQQEPFPAVVMNRRWDILQTNQAAKRFFSFLLDGGEARADSSVRPNVLRLMFDPAGLRPHVTNWEDVAAALLQRVHREAIGGIKDEATTLLLAELLAYPGVPGRLRRPDLQSPQLPVISVQFSRHGRAFNFFSTVTTLGTAQDITLQELRIECFFPGDVDTETHIRALAGPN
jgi:transcriptional regulator with XRE-family HTH domain